MRKNMWNRIRGYVAAGVALITCPCHLVLTLPLFLSITAGTAAGAFLERNYYAVIVVSIIFPLKPNPFHGNNIYPKGPAAVTNKILIVCFQTGWSLTFPLARLCLFFKIIFYHIKKKYRIWGKNSKKATKN